MEQLTKEQFQAKAQAVAGFLPEWNYKVCGEDTNTETHARITGPGGMSIMISRYWNDHGKAHASGSYPLGHKGQYHGARGWGAIHYDAKEPECSFNLSKSPEQIANDIKRRLLPEYERVYAACIEARKKEDEYYNLLAANVKRLASILGVEVKEQSLDTGKFYAQIGDRRIEVQVSQDSAELEIHGLTLDEGHGMCELLKSFPAKN